LVWQDVCDLLTHPELITQALERAHGGRWLPQELKARRDQLRQGRPNLDHQSDRLSEAYLHGIIPLAEFERRRRELGQKGQAPETQAGQLPSCPALFATGASTCTWCSTCSAASSSAG
jgi:site-specific DNA recombinase